MALGPTFFLFLSANNALCERLEVVGETTTARLVAQTVHPPFLGSLPNQNPSVRWANCPRAGLLFGKVDITSKNCAVVKERWFFVPAARQSFTACHLAANANPLTIFVLELWVRQFNRTFCTSTGNPKQKDRTLHVRSDDTQ